jgi:malate dehydrogenase
MVRPRILVIGAGMVGSTSAASIAARNLGTVCLHDIEENLAMGRAMDINHCLPSRGSDSLVAGCNDLGEAGPADIVVIAAGMARTAGMTRFDLLRNNARVIESLAPRIAAQCPGARVLVVTNPVDVLTWHMGNLCPGLTVMGLGCSLDTIRLRHLIARAAGVSAASVAAMVMGTHDDNMIPLVSRASIGGIPATTLLDPAEIPDIIRQTRTAGGTIVNLMKTHSGHYAAGEIVALVVESMAMDRGMVFPVSVRVSGEYGYRDTCLSLPCVIDARGVRRVIELDLDEEERALLAVCARSMAEQVRTLRS